MDPSPFFSSRSPGVVSCRWPREPRRWPSPHLQFGKWRPRSRPSPPRSPLRPPRERRLPAPPPQRCSRWRARWMPTPRRRSAPSSRRWSRRCRRTSRPAQRTGQCGRADPDHAGRGGADLDTRGRRERVRHRRLRRGDGVGLRRPSRRGGEPARIRCSTSWHHGGVSVGTPPPTRSSPGGPLLPTCLTSIGEGRLVLQLHFQHTGRHARGGESCRPA
jgi:hypothetical protein